MNWMGFKEFTYEQIIPACLVAPLKPSFDLDDGQSFLVSNSNLCTSYVRGLGHIM